MRIDDLLRGVLFRGFRLGSLRFDFLEGLLAVCITGAGYLLRTPFEPGVPHWTCLLAEWYLCLASAVLVGRYTGSRRKSLGTYGILMILPAVVAEGTILGGGACAGALLFVCALLFLGQGQGNGRTWLFTLVTAGLLLWSVRYIGLLFACMVLWKKGRLRVEQLLVLLAAGGARFVHAYRAWFGAGYTLETFHWPNIYELVGREAVQGQLVDPAACVGFFLTLGLMLFLIHLYRPGEQEEEPASLLRLFLFFGLTCGYFLPYMDQSYGILYSVLAVLYFMTALEEFLLPMLLQIVVFAGYQECFHGASMMPMALFSALQFLIICLLGMQIYVTSGERRHG